jgi:hypothetical protein
MGALVAMKPDRQHDIDSKKRESASYVQYFNLNLTNKPQNLLVQYV